MQFKSDAQRKAVHANKRRKTSSLHANDVNKSNNVSTRNPKLVSINPNNINQTEVDEIVLAMENDGDFYRQVISPISDSFEKKMKSGKFRQENALMTKSFVDSVGKRAIEKYDKEYGSGGLAKSINIDTRRKIGQELLKNAMRMARENMHYDKITKTDKGRAMMKRDELKTQQENELIKHGMHNF